MVLSPPPSANRPHTCALVSVQRFLSPLVSNRSTERDAHIAHTMIEDVKVECDGALRWGVTTVFWDGGCPLCVKEIAILKRVAATDPVRPINFFDISGPDETGPLKTAFGVPLADALARMHVVDGEGQLHTSARAFVAMWACLRGFHHLATVARAIPLVLPVLELGYVGWGWLRHALTGGTSTTAAAGASCRVSGDCGSSAESARAPGGVGTPT